MLGSYKDPLWVRSLTAPLCLPMSDCMFCYRQCEELREATLPGGREEWPDCLVTGPPFPLSFGEGQRQQPYTGAKGVLFLWGREGQCEGPYRKGAIELFLESSQST